MPVHARRSLRRAATAAALLLACLLPAAAPALDPDKRIHQYVSNTWSIEHGLPQITVNAITQDHDGYIWAGTQLGLARFDGNRFSTWSTREADGLPGGHVQALATDASGAVWIGTYKGLAVWSEGRMRVVPASVGGDVDVLGIALSGDRVMVATSAGPMAVVDGALQPRPWAHGPVFSVAADDGRVIWGGLSGVTVETADGIREWPLPESHEGVAARRLLLDRAGGLWVGTGRGLFRPGQDRLLPHAPGDERLAGAIQALHQDRDGLLWVSTPDFLLRLHDGEVTDLAGPGHPAVPSSVLAVHEDREGNLWLGTQSDGLTRLWNGWTRRFSQPEGLHEPMLWSVARREDGGILLGTSDGLAELRDGRIRLLVPGHQLPHPHAYTLLVDGEAIWIGTRSGVARWVRGRVDTPAPLRALDSTQVNGLHRDADGRLWLVTNDGLHRFDGTSLSRFGSGEGIVDPRIRLMVPQAPGRFVLGTQSGPLVFQDGRARPLDFGHGLPTGLDVTAIQRLADGSLLLGTLSERLFHSRGERWVELTGPGGMQPNAAFHIAQDSQGWVWIGGIRGIQRFPAQALDDFVEGRIDQLPAHFLLNERGIYRGGQKGYCCNGAGHAKGFLHADRAWFPSRDGVVSIAAGDVHLNAVAPQVLVERVWHAGEWRLVHNGLDLGELPGGSRDLGFEFTATSLQQPESIEILYRLEGYDGDWQRLDDLSRRSVTYTNLPPGEYRFLVRASNNAGVWAGADAAVDFSIRPRFHETAWFYLSIALVGVFLGWLVGRWRQRVLRQRQRELELLVDARTADLAEANARLEQASLTDPLTRLHNRRYLQEQLPRDLAFYARSLRPVAGADEAMLLAMVDIDHFKALNDGHGHLAGDEVLRAFADRLAEQVRRGDYVTRWGGEEFLLVMRPMPRSQAPEIIERLRGSVAASPFTLESGTALRVTCSIGFVCFPPWPGADAPVDHEALVELADRALYAAKRAGRNRWAGWAPGPLPTLLPGERIQACDVDRIVEGGHLVLEVGSADG